jgi:hypothetical protein
VPMDFAFQDTIFTFLYFSMTMGSFIEHSLDKARSNAPGHFRFGWFALSLERSDKIHHKAGRHEE